MLVLKAHPNNKDLMNFNLSENFEGVLLIGKDGGLKARHPLLVQPQTLFVLVDGMPMRKAEMRKGKKH